LSSVIHEHRTYLSDHPRLDAYNAAIQEAVRPGDVVLDLGCGTGILGLLACRAGASRVYAVDSTGMIEVARRLARDNGMNDRIVHLNEPSLQARLPERVDVVVCDQMSSFGIGAGVIDYMTDAHERFLKPGGILIPRQLTLEVAPVEMNDLRADVEFWGSAPAGFEFGSVRKLAVNNTYTAKYRDTQLLSSPLSAVTLDLSFRSPSAFTFAVSFDVRRTGTFEGIAGWFRAQLSSNAKMSNSPLDPHAIDRHAAFFPVERAVAVREGDVIDLEMHIIPRESVTTWKTRVCRRNTADANPEEIASFVNSTFNGMIVSREHLAKTRPTFRPKLTRRGEARAFALALCNGKRPLSEIEESLFDEYRDLFVRRDDAGVFVSEVVSRHTE